MSPTIIRRWSSTLTVPALFAAVGCSATVPPPTRSPTTGAVTAAPAGDDVAAERAKLSPNDRAAVDAQEWCAINADERLGSMGPPVKVMVKDQPVYLCCKGCQKEALAEPDKTLAAVAAHKAKAGAKK